MRSEFKTVSKGWKQFLSVFIKSIVKKNKEHNIIKTNVSIHLDQLKLMLKMRKLFIIYNKVLVLFFCYQSREKQLSVYIDVEQ